MNARMPLLFPESCKAKPLIVGVVSSEIAGSFCLLLPVNDAVMQRRLSEFAMRPAHKNKEAC